MNAVFKAFQSKWTPVIALTYANYALKEKKKQERGNGTQ